MSTREALSGAKTTTVDRRNVGPGRRARDTAPLSKVRADGNGKISSKVRCGVCSEVDDENLLGVTRGYENFAFCFNSFSILEFFSSEIVPHG